MAKWIVGAALVACSAVAAAVPVRRGGERASVPVPGVLLRWGAGAGEVGLRPARPEFPAAGPESVAVGADGSAWILDRQNLRVARVLDGRFDTFPVPADMVELAVSSDGVAAGFSALRSRVWLFDGGQAAGELPVPRTLGEVVGVSVGASRQVFVHTAYQETFNAGSPSVPQVEAEMRATYREGAALLPSGDGVSVQKSASGELSLVVTRMADRAVEVARFPFARGAAAGTIAGVAGDVACVKVERAESQKPFRVGRRVTCVDAKTGRVVLDEALAAPGLYRPRRELAVGGVPARVVHLSPEREGLRLRSWDLVAGGVR